MCWINTYLGPPNSITTNTGKNFVSQEFLDYAITIGITLNAVSIEAHYSIGIIECYYSFI